MRIKVSLKKSRMFFCSEPKADTCSVMLQVFFYTINGIQVKLIYKYKPCCRSSPFCCIYLEKQNGGSIHEFTIFFTFQKIIIKTFQETRQNDISQVLYAMRGVISCAIGEEVNTHGVYFFTKRGGEI